MENHSRYLLIMACSQRKRPDPGLLPAIERYDGVNFRVLEKAKREGNWPQNLDILILSAKYGLIASKTPIENYDFKMTVTQALAFQGQVSAGLDSYLRSISYSEIFINLGVTYLTALKLSKELVNQSNKIYYATGGIGEKMSKMKRWLTEISRTNTTNS
jgi:cytoplasmic iron level regulating protein YaaA (DUF328/UPF0246 family)